MEEILSVHFLQNTGSCELCHKKSLTLFTLLKHIIWNVTIKIVLTNYDHLFVKGPMCNI